MATTSMYTSMLGCKNNRQDNLKKLARTTAYRLAREYLQKNKTTDSSVKRVQNKFTIKAGSKFENKAKVNNTRTNIVPTNPSNRTTFNPNPQLNNKKVTSLTSVGDATDSKTSSKAISSQKVQN